MKKEQIKRNLKYDLCDLIGGTIEKQVGGQFNGPLGSEIRDKLEHKIWHKTWAGFGDLLDYQLHRQAFKGVE